MSPFIEYGPLSPDSPMFFGRNQELAQLKRLCQGSVDKYAIIYGARQTGKTSLLFRLQEQLPEETMHTCIIDFQEIPRAESPAAYQYIACEIAESLNLSKPVVSSSLELGKTLNLIIEKLGARKLVLCLEELGSLLPETRKDIANIFRKYFTHRNKKGNPLARLMVIFAGSIEMYDLAQTKVSPLNNVCQKFYLPDLVHEDAVALIQKGLGEFIIPGVILTELAEAIYEKLNGHPSLTQQVGAYLEGAHLNGEELSSEHVEMALDHLMEHSPTTQHFYKCLQEENLFPAVTELLKGEIRTSRNDTQMARLELIGVAVQKGTSWHLRNPFFKDLITRWVETGKHQQTSSNGGVWTGDIRAQSVTIVSGRENTVGNGNIEVGDVSDSSGITVKRDSTKEE